MSYIDVVDKVDVPKPPRYYTPPSFETVGGLPIAYRRAGQGEAVVLLHGAGFTRMWIPFYHMMAERCDFIAPEQPGFGETPLPKWFRTFDDLTLLDDRSIQRLLKEVETKDLAIALKAASDEVKNKIFSNVSERVAVMIREEMEFMGPTRLSDVEAAQGRIVEAVRRLEEEGQIIVSGRGGKEDIIV